MPEPELIFVTNITNYNCGEKIFMWRKIKPKKYICGEKWQIWGLLFDPQLFLSTAYKLFLIFNDVSWFMQPFIQCLDTKTLHLPLRLPHGSPPSPWKTCKILLKLRCRQASSPNQKFWEQSHCWKCNIGVTASPKEQSLTNTSWIWETPVRQGRGPRTHQITKA